MIYFILFLYEAVVCYIYDKMLMNDKRAFQVHDSKLQISISKGLTSLAIIVPIWFVMGLRYNIGTDYRAYETIFRISVLYNENIYNMEPGYYYLNRIAGSISGNPQIIFFLVSFLIVIFFFKGLERNNGNMYYGVLTFIGMGYYFYAMNIQRQYIAMMIMLYAFSFLEKKKIKQYIVCAAIAAGFHSAGIIWIPVYFAVNYIPTKAFYVGSFVIAFLVNRSANYTLNILANIGFYTGQIMNNKSFFRERLSLTNVLISGLFLVCGVIFQKQLKEKGEQISLKFKIIWLVFLIYAFMYPLGDAATRIATYMCIVYFLLISDIINCFDIYTRKLIRVSITIILMILTYIIINYSGNAANAFLPYQYRLL